MGGFEISDIIELSTTDDDTDASPIVEDAHERDLARPAIWQLPRESARSGDSALGLPDVRNLLPRDRAVATRAFWMEALYRARMQEPLREPLVFQGATDPLHGAADAVQRLREEMASCVMAFPAVLAIRRTEPLADYPGWSVWDVDVPLTLFASRDRVFTVVDIAVQFHHAGPGGVQITAIEPRPQMRSLATIHMASYLKTSMSLAASQAASIPLPPQLGTEVATVTKIASALDLELRADAIDFEVQRMCRDAAILDGRRAVWRLDRPDKPPTPRLDAAQLSIRVAVAPDAGPVTAYGAAIGSTSAPWLSAALPSLGRQLRGLLGDLFVTRQPIECRAEWKHLFDRG